MFSVLLKIRASPFFCESGRLILRALNYYIKFKKLVKYARISHFLVVKPLPAPARHCVFAPAFARAGTITAARASAAQACQSCSAGGEPDILPVRADRPALFYRRGCAKNAAAISGPRVIRVTAGISAYGAKHSSGLHVDNNPATGNRLPNELRLSDLNHGRH